MVDSMTDSDTKKTFHDSVDTQKYPKSAYWTPQSYMFLSSRRLECMLGSSHLEPSEEIDFSGRPSQNRLSCLSQLPQIQEWTSPLRFSYQADQKTYMNHLIWSSDKLIMNFRSFFCLESLVPSRLSRLSQFSSKKQYSRPVETGLADSQVSYADFSAIFESV